MTEAKSNNNIKHDRCKCDCAAKKDEDAYTNCRKPEEEQKEWDDHNKQTKRDRTSGRPKKDRSIVSKTQSREGQGDENGEERLQNIADSISRIQGLHRSIKEEMNKVKDNLSNRTSILEKRCRILSSDAKELSRMIELARCLNENFVFKNVRASLEEQLKKL